MTRQIHYLDYNATAPMTPRAKQALVEALGLVGNPSSIHHWGKVQKNALEEARRKILHHLGADKHRLIFVSGGTEANNLALTGTGAKRVFVSSASHPSCATLPHVTPVPVDGNGRVNLEALVSMIVASDTPFLVSAPLASHETGVIEHADQLLTCVRAFGGLMHFDAVQAVGRMAVSLDTLDADLLSLSSPKVGGPAGVGALIIKGALTLTPMLYGGGQEYFARSGTQNTPGAVAFAVALGEALSQDWEDARTARDLLESLLKAQGAHIIGDQNPRLPNTTCVHMPGVSAQEQVIFFDVEGFGVSAGSACGSGRIQASPVLTAMGFVQAAQESIRISLSPHTPIHVIESFITVWRTLYGRVQNNKRVS